MGNFWLERADLLLGAVGSERLKRAHVLIVGLGGVGSFAAEFIVRSGVAKLTIVDGDDIDVTNINRQLPALHSTIGKQKVEEVGRRLLDINPQLALIQINEFLMPNQMQSLIKKGEYDYVMDCIDSVTPKVQLIKACRNQKVRCVSAMGAGGKMNPAKVTVKDISKVSGCKLGARVKKELKKVNIDRGVRAVFSTESAKENALQLTDGQHYKKSFYGTVSYMPALFGLYAAAEVINYLRGE